MEQPGEYEIPAGYPPNWHELRREVYRRDNYMCQDGGETQVRLFAHHIVPIWDGGGHEMSNLVALCERCHDRRHVLISEERRELRRQLRTQFRWDAQSVVALIILGLMVAWVLAAIFWR